MAMKAHEIAFVETAIRNAVADAVAPRELPKFLRIAKAAELADVSPQTLRKWIRDGKLTPYRAGSDHRILLSELIEAMSPENEANALDISDRVSAMMRGDG